MYYKEGHFDGQLEAAGGFGNREYGAAGTVFIQKGHNATYRGYRTLRVDNNNKRITAFRINQVCVFCLLFYLSVGCYL